MLQLGGLVAKHDELRALQLLIGGAMLRLELEAVVLLAVAGLQNVDRGHTAL